MSMAGCTTRSSDEKPLAMLESGVGVADVASLTGIHRSTLREWRDADPERAPRRPCPTCDEVAIDDGAAYSHLLGLYLGDGCISTARRGVHVLRIACAHAYPGLISECEESIRLVRPGPVCRVRSEGCVYVTGYWTHWPCLFSQHGPGRKHDRPIVLADCQRELVEQHPGRFLRGLFHSDGCRITNWATRTIGTGVDRRTKGYEYPRISPATSRRTSSTSARGPSTCSASPTAVRSRSTSRWRGGRRLLCSTSTSVPSREPPVAHVSRAAQSRQAPPAAAAEAYAWNVVAGSPVTS